MRYTIVILSYLFCTADAIWPAPKTYTHGKEVLWIKSNLSVTYSGASVRKYILPLNLHAQYIKSPTEKMPQKQFYTSNLTSPTLFSSKDIVSAAVQRSLGIIMQEKFVPWKFYPRNNLSQFEPAANATKTYLSCLDITQTQLDSPATFQSLAGEVDESYELSVAANGRASIVAVSSTGILRALDTFTQLFYQHSQPGLGIYTPLVPVQIADAPKFSYRGLNMDISRNWYPIPDIKRMIDAISWNKFNRLHLHMTDAQSWPIDIPALPELSLKGAYQAGLSYTPADIQAIQEYAIYRGVQIIIEIDMPGHTSAIAYSHPELIAAFDAQPWGTYCAEPPCGSLKLDLPAVATFLETLLDDLLPRVKPYSAYFHTGGDEVHANAYLLDETVRSNATAVLTPLLQKFLDRNHAQVRAAGLTPMVWEEQLLQWGLKLGSDVVVQTWQSDQAVIDTVNAGHKALAGNYEYWVSHCHHRRSHSVSFRIPHFPTNTSSTSTVAKVNGSTSPMALASRPTTLSSTTAHPPRTGGSSTRMTPSQISMPAKRPSCSVARCTSGLSRPIP